MSAQQATHDTSIEPGRSAELELEIDAPVDAVWKALTDADELTRWFPPEARVRPGLGGSIWMRWKDVYEADSIIEVWEPERHLRTMFPEEGLGPLTTDYYLEGRGGGTVLRVVTSGFGAGEDWNELLAGVRCGWDFELRGLQHYLERHRGQDRVTASARAKHTGSHTEAWGVLLGRGGWFAVDGLTDATVGKRYAVRTATGDQLAGTVRVWDPPRQFVGTAEGWNDALLRVELFADTATIWMSTYGVPAADVRSLERSWQESLGKLFQASQ